MERVLAVLGATALLVAGFDAVTYAATGSSLLLGKWNYAGTTTRIVNTGSGAALDLRVASSSTPPLTVNSSAVVPNLHAANSDRLGGAAASTYRRACQEGTIKAKATAFPSDSSYSGNGVGATYVCSGGSVVARRVSTGIFRFRFGYDAAAGKPGVTGLPMATAETSFCPFASVTVATYSDTSVTPAANTLEVRAYDAAGAPVDCAVHVALM